MTIDTNKNFNYLIEQIRSNLLTTNENENFKETPRAHAWLLTTLAIYGNDFQVLIDLYRLFREQKSYILLSFIIEHIIQYHRNEVDNNLYLQNEFQLIFSKSNCNVIEQFSYSRVYSLLSSSTREIISTLLIQNSYIELEKNLLLSTESLEKLNQCRDQALACLSLSSSSIASILQLIIKIESQIGFHTQKTSLNILRCLFVQDLLPLVLQSEQKFDIQTHVCHRWLISAIEFYFEYWISTLKTSTNQIKLEGNNEKTFQCENPIEQIDKLLNLTLNMPENFNWQQFITQTGNSIISSNRLQKLLELRLLIDRTHQSTIHCPLECFLFCTSFPIYIQSIVNLSKSFHQDYLFLHSTKSFRNHLQQQQQNDFEQVDIMENFYLFIECLKLLQLSSMSSCVKFFQETIDKIHLSSHIEIYGRLLRSFYFYYIIEKTKVPQEKNPNKTVIIDDTPQSPTAQDDSNVSTISPLLCPDLDTFIQQLNDQSLESRLQLCSLYFISHFKQLTSVSFCIDTLVYFHENFSTTNVSQENLLSILSDYCLIPRSYPIIFHYLLDLILQQLPPILILLQIEQEHLISSNYPKDLLSTLTPLSLRYIYDQKLLKQLLKYIQTTTKSERRWTINSTNKRKLDREENKINDEQFIEKIIQHVSNITQWTEEQKQQAIYSYIINEKQTLLQLFK